MMTGQKFTGAATGAHRFQEDQNVANTAPEEVRDLGRTGRIFGALDDFVARQSFDDGSAVTWTTEMSASAFVSACIQFTNKNGEGIAAYVRTQGTETTIDGSEVLARLTSDIDAPTRVKLITDDFAETIVWTRAGANVPHAATAAVLDPDGSDLRHLGADHLLKMMQNTGTDAAQTVFVDPSVQTSLGIHS